MQPSNDDAKRPRLYCVAYWKQNGGWQIRHDVTAAHIAHDMRQFPGFIFDRAVPLSEVKSRLFSRMFQAGLMPV